MTAHFRHVPARLRVDANVCGLACGYAAIFLLVPLWFTEGAKKAELGVRLAVWGLQERHFYSPDNYKLNRTAALTEWRQLLSA